MFSEQEQQHAGTATRRIDGFGDRPGLHGDERVLRPQTDERRGIDPRDPPPTWEVRGAKFEVRGRGLQWPFRTPHFVRDSTELVEVRTSHASGFELVAKFGDLARQKGCTASQLALAWVLAQGEDIVPIPGTKRTKYLDENLGALTVTLTPDELRQIDAVLPAVAGARYHAQAMQAIDR